jgi:transcriptional regulator with XRE-family HTH domain
MATTLATVEAREVLRCEHCSLVQFRTMDSHCRRCRKPLEAEEPEPQLLALLPALHARHSQTLAAGPPSVDVAKAVRDLRHERGLSQRELALRMEVPRTYISKIENGKAQPTLASLERLARALGADICELLHDARSRRQDAVSAALADPFLTDLLPHVARMNAYQRSVILSHARDMATGRRRPAQA